MNVVLLGDEDQSKRQILKLLINREIEYLGIIGVYGMQLQKNNENIGIQVYAIDFEDFENFMNFEFITEQFLKNSLFIFI